MIWEKKKYCNHWREQWHRRDSKNAFGECRGGAKCADVFQIKIRKSGQLDTTSDLQGYGWFTLKKEKWFVYCPGTIPYSSPFIGHG